MFDYSPTTETNGTSKKCYQLKEDTRAMLGTFTPEKLTKAFGSGNVKFGKPMRAKGYTDPEWMFKSSDGQVVGIGFRWGTPRLRGSFNLSDSRANDFITTVNALIEHSC